MASTFYFQNGMQCEDIPGLIQALESIDDETFKAHRNSKKNDFYSWISDGLQLHGIAKVVKSARTRKGMIQRLKQSSS